MIPFSLRNILEVMIKSITNFLIIFFIFQQLKSQISQIDQNGVKPFCDETLQVILHIKLRCSMKNSFPDTFMYIYNLKTCKYAQFKLFILIYESLKYYLFFVLIRTRNDFMQTGFCYQYYIVHEST